MSAGRPWGDDRLTGASRLWCRPGSTTIRPVCARFLKKEPKGRVDPKTDKRHNWRPMSVFELDTTLGRRSFEEFHARRAGDALRYAAAIVGQREAEDACQEA